MRVVLPSSYETLVAKIKGPQGLDLDSAPAWLPLRTALAVSLADPTPPGPAPDLRGWEMALKQLTGQGQAEKDYDPAIRLLLTVRHGKNLFASHSEYGKLLVEHINRGLTQLVAVIDEGRSLHMFLADLITPASAATSELKQDSIISQLLELGIRAELVRATHGPRLDHFLLKLARPEYLTQLERSLDELAFALGARDLGMERGDAALEIALVIPRPVHKWHMVESKDFGSWLASPTDGMHLRVIPGVDTLGIPMAFDLTEAPHLLVAGTTGSGKTVCVHAILLSLACCYSHRDVELVLIDPKGTEFSEYARLPHSRHHDVASESVEAVHRLEEILEELDRRQRQLAQVKHRNLTEARAAGALKLPYIVVVVEEMADLVLGTQEAQELLVRIAQKSRSAGIHLVLATQRPDAETFSGLLRTNVPARIALTVAKASESRIILDEEGAERLLGKGDMLIRFPSKPTKRAHGVFLSTDDVRNMIDTVIKGK